MFYNILFYLEKYYNAYYLCSTNINNNNQLRLKSMETKTIFWSELSEMQKLAFLEENEEYLTWADGTPIRADEMNRFSLVYNGQFWSLTLKDGDFYIEDVIF